MAKERRVTHKRIWYPTKENGLSEAQCQAIENIRNDPNSGIVSDIMAYRQMQYHNKCVSGSCFRKQ